MSPERLVAPKSYCAAVGIFACALLAPYKPSLTTEKKPGSAFCVAKPPKPLAAESYRGAVGIFWVGLACHNRCPNLQAPPSGSKGPVASWMRRQASGFNPGVLQIFRSSNPPSRGCLRSSFCLGSCRAFKGQSKKRTLFTGRSWPATPARSLPTGTAGLSQKLWYVCAVWGLEQHANSTAAYVWMIFDDPSLDDMQCILDIHIHTLYNYIYIYLYLGTFLVAAKRS